MQSSRKPRPLGVVRASLTGLDKIPHLPRLSHSSENSFHGIQGSAMNVPPTYVKESPSMIAYEPVDDKRKSSSKSNQSESSRSNRSPDLISKKELREALGREKEYKSKIEELLKLIEELRNEILLKEQSIEQLQNDVIIKENDFKNQLTSELNLHEETKTKLTNSNGLVVQLQQQMKNLKIEHENKTVRLKRETEEKLNTVITEKDKEINIREEKLNKLKQHMADALQGNSWERQQQLEELTKELAKIQDEADSLRSKVKSLSKAKEGVCSHCEETKYKLKKTIQIVKEKDHTINDLQSIAAKFESQLTQQDQLLKLWADEKGFKVELPK